MQGSNQTNVHDMIYCIIAKASLIARGSRLHQTMSFIIDQHAPRDTDSFGDLSHLKKFFLACFHFCLLARLDNPAS